jgi:hypothetical protein
MSKKKKKNTTKSSKTKKSGEALRKDALGTVQKNLEAIDAKERGDGAKKAGRMSKSAARAEGAAKVKAATAGKAKTPKPAKSAKERRPSGLDLAANVLAASKEPLTAKAIAERTIAVGWKTSGRTPHATLYAAIIREIAAKGNMARFKKTDRGLFTANAGVK